MSGGFGCSKPFQARAGTGSGRPNAVLEPILSRPGRALSGRGRSKSAPGRVPSLPQTVTKRRPMGIGATSAVERARRTIFRRFGLVARKVRCGLRASFYNVLLGSDEVSTKRVRVSKKLENRYVSASKIDSGTVWATQNRAPAVESRVRGASGVSEN